VAPFDAVVEHLNATPPCLVILDNFEHLAEGHAEMVVQLLQRVPKLQVIVTTRIPLKVDGEVLISLAPLPLPSEATVDLRSLAENPAIALFVDRAQAVKPDFQLTERTAQTIVELSRKLEGLPLALELAAGWARVLTPSQMLDQVTENVDNLASRRKDITPRHRSLRAAFDGSFALLDDSMKNVFLRMTVMTGGWCLTAAQHLCPGEDTDTVIQALEERSLIFSEPTDRAIRFAMLETIRAFGEGIVSPDLRLECKWLHAEYFLELVERKIPEPDWLAAVAADYANCLTALKWFEENKRSDSFARFAIALAPYWEASGLLADGREVLIRALNMGSLLDPLLCARTKAAAANLGWLTGNYQVAVGRVNEALELFRAYDAKHDQIEAQFLLQMEAHRVGDYEEAKRWLHTNLEIATEMEDLVAQSRCWLSIGNVAVETGDMDEAQTTYERSLELGRKAGDADRIGSALTNLANLAIYRGQMDAARTWIAEAISLLTPGVHRWKTAMSLIVLGRLENELGNYPEAVHTLIRAHRTAPDENLVVWRFLLQFGFTLVGLGHVKQAVRIFGYFERYRERIGESHRGLEMKLYEERVAKLKEEMTPELFEEQLNIGRNMSFEDIENFIYRVQRSF
jgi:tetratricopeptide (TPR) repeat protein